MRGATTIQLQLADLELPGAAEKTTPPERGMGKPKATPRGRELELSQPHGTSPPEAAPQKTSFCSAASAEKPAFDV
eukprot:gene29139-17986_t